MFSKNSIITITQKKEQRPETKSHLYGHLIYEHNDSSKQEEIGHCFSNDAGTMEHP